MPRHSSSGNDESPAPRRSSARIAACQVNKPASPSPAKKPAVRRKSKKAAEEEALPSIEENKIDVNGSEVGMMVLNSGDAITTEPCIKKQKIDSPYESPGKMLEGHESTLSNSISKHIPTEETETGTHKDIPPVEEPTIKHTDAHRADDIGDLQHHTLPETEVYKTEIHERNVEVDKPTAVEIIHNENIPIGVVADTQESAAEENVVIAHDLPQSELDAADIPTSITEKSGWNSHDLPPFESTDDIQPSMDRGHETCSASVTSEVQSECQAVMEEQSEEVVSQDVEAAH